MDRGINDKGNQKMKTVNKKQQEQKNMSASPWMCLSAMFLEGCQHGVGV